MLHRTRQRSQHLLQLARARMAAAEQDPHTWAANWPDTRVVLVMDVVKLMGRVPETNG